MGMQISKIGLWMGTAVLVAGLAACAPVYRNHGYVPSQEALSSLKVGSSSREAVIAALGTPSAEGLLTNNVLYYVQSRFEHFGPRAPKEIEREVLAVSFAGNRLRNIERFGLERGRVVPLYRAVTSSSIADNTLLRQLLGNLTNISAAPTPSE